MLGGGYEQMLEGVQAPEEGGDGDVVEGEALVLVFGHDVGLWYEEMMAVVCYVV